MRWYEVSPRQGSDLREPLLWGHQHFHGVLPRNLKQCCSVDVHQNVVQVKLIQAAKYLHMKPQTTLPVQA